MKMKASASIGGPIGIAVFLSLILAASAVDATTVKVYPASQTVAAGDAFQVELIVVDVYDLKGNAAGLNFDSDVIQVTGITEGAFLKTGGTTMPISSWNNVTGTATFASALGFFDPWTTVSGSGILATIQFSTYPGAPADTYDLGLTGVELRNASNELIPTDVVDGAVTILSPTTSTPTSTRTSTSGSSGGGVVIFDATGEGTTDMNITDTISSTPATTTPTTTTPDTITNVSANATTDTPPTSTPSSVPGLNGTDVIAASGMLVILFAVRKRKRK